MAKEEEVPPKKPNFVFFLIDDLGWRDVGCFGSTFYETPNIDRLAREGMRFTDAYAACPVCSPTRASIMTGKNPARLHLTNWLVGKEWPQESPLVSIPDWQKFLPLEEVTIAEALKEAGYATGYVGKWHLGDEPYSPENQGFVHNVGGCHMGFPKTYFDPYKIPKLPDRRQGEYLTDRLAEEAVRFIKAHAREPFFLYFAHYAVHIPLAAKAEHIEKYRRKAAAMKPEGPELGREGPNPLRLIQSHPVYAGMVESVDDTVGRILRKLEDLGLADNTAVFFFSDNGGLSTAQGSPTSNLPLRAGKGWVYEGGIREPTIIKWPGVTPPGSVCDTPVISDDFYPTFLQIAGLGLRPEQHMDGTSLVPLLKREGGWQRDTLYWHYPHFSGQGGRPGGAIRCGDWKLVEYFEDGRLELYNLRDDLGEQKDLATAMPEKARELQTMLADWRRTVGAQMPGRRPESKPKESENG